MGVRVDKGSKVFLSRFTKHQKALASRQYLERREEEKERILKQATERDKRATSRAPTKETKARGENGENQRMRKPTSEGIKTHNSSEINSSSPSSPSREEDLVSSIKFKKMPSRTQTNNKGQASQDQSTSRSGQLSREQNSTQLGDDLRNLIREVIGKHGLKITFNRFWKDRRTLVSVILERRGFQYSIPFKWIPESVSTPSINVRGTVRFMLDSSE